jgi:hypothetical protein
MKVHINYANGRYLNSQRLCCETSIKVGGFDESIGYGLQDIDKEFLQANSYIFSQPRGAGYWLWKPYFILKHLHMMGEKDWLMYTDSGMYFDRNPWEWIPLHAWEGADEKGIMTFGNCGINSQFTKRDCFVLMGMDTEFHRKSPHRMASVFLCKKTETSVSFVEEWLSYAKDPRILTDLPNTQMLPNYEEFKDHRHDQSIMSLLTLKYGTYVFADKDITQHGNHQDPCIIHTRNPN